MLAKVQYALVAVWWSACRICNREVAGLNLGRGLLRTKVYSAFHPSGVGKWVPAAAGKAKTGMAHSACWWNTGCVGKTVLSLDNACYTWAPWGYFKWRRYTNWLLFTVRVAVLCSTLHREGASPCSDIEPPSM